MSTNRADWLRSWSALSFGTWLAYRGCMIPADRNAFETNLPPDELEKVIAAIESEKVVWDKSKYFGFAEMASGEFEFEGTRYEIDEWLEYVIRLNKL